MFSFPTTKTCKRDIFYAGATLCYRVPSWATLLNIVCIGGAGAGGNGGGFPSGAQSGGGGGGSGGYTSLTIQTRFLPEVLYLSPGSGGKTNLDDGERSLVSVYPGITDAAYLVCASGQTAAQGGLNGSGSTAGVGGAGETVLTAADSIFLSLGNWKSIAGQAGGTGSNGTTTGGSVTALVTPIGSGGAGGGGISSGGVIRAGGSITGAGPLATLAGGSTDNQAGIDGYNILSSPWYSTGGSGTAGSSAASGERSGSGGLASGGAGGPGTRDVGGPPGFGGDGLIMITAW